MEARPAPKPTPTKPKPSPKGNLQGVPKGKLVKIIREHETREQQRIELIKNQHGLIQRQSGSLIWLARQIVALGKKFPDAKKDKTFAELFKMSANLVTQADDVEKQQRKAQQEAHGDEPEPKAKATRKGGKRKG